MIPAKYKFELLQQRDLLMAYFPFVEFEDQHVFYGEIAAIMAKVNKLNKFTGWETYHVELDFTTVEFESKLNDIDI